MDKKNIVVEAHDSYGDCLLDKSQDNNYKLDRNHPHGFVEIYETENGKKKQLLGKHNLVVYLGREWLLSHAFMTQNENISPAYDEYICWFGVGTGGAPIGDPFTPTSPTNLDTDLASSVMIDTTSVIYADYRTTPDTGYYKCPPTDYTFEQDADNDNSWLILKVSSTLTVGDCIGYNINEAGLFTAQSNQGGYSGDFHLYARITFPTIVKTDSRQLLFIWYIYF